MQSLIQLERLLKKRQLIRSELDLLRRRPALPCPVRVPGPDANCRNYMMRKARRL